MQSSKVLQRQPGLERKQPLYQASQLADWVAPVTVLWTRQNHSDVNTFRLPTQGCARRLFANAFVDDKKTGGCVDSAAPQSTNKQSQRKFLQIRLGCFLPYDSEIEVRQIFEAEDYGAEFTLELREQEERSRAQITH